MVATSELALFADGVSVTYDVRSARGLRVRRRRVVAAQVHSLVDVTFRLHAGETVGLIGVNGAGKSTLMKVMAGVLRPDAGSVWASAEPAVLSMGGVLNVRHTGRVNIELGLLALGWSRDRIRSELDSIVRFAELEAAIDRPVGTYSSGMRARLKFAIATSLEPKILLVDEALAVGDEGFRERSRRRLAELTDNSGAVVMVTHNLLRVEQTCDRAVWLAAGRVRAEGDPREIVGAYRTEVRGSR